MKSIDIRQQQKIMANLFEKTIRNSPEPVLYVMAGIPAAGKTTFLKLQNKKGALPKGHYYHNPDLVMEHIENYQSDLKNNGPEQAKQYWEIPARNFADTTLFPHALSNKTNIVMDMGMCRPDILQMVQSGKSNGYYIHMQIIYCSLEEAISRSQKRERYVSEQIIKERADFFAANMETILSLADDMKICDNSHIETPYIPITVTELISRIQGYRCNYLSGV